MAAWRKQKEDVARHHQGKGEVNEIKKVVIVNGSIKHVRLDQMAYLTNQRHHGNKIDRDLRSA